MKAFFGGTFDPIHNGHIGFAIHVLENFSNVDEVLFSPAVRNPLKPQRFPQNPQHRARMVALGIEGIDDCSLYEDELQREGPSYTVDTLRSLVATTGDRVKILMGSDSVATFHEWKNPMEILALADPIIACRKLEDPFKNFLGTQEMRKQLEQGMIEIPIMEISSTNIRERIKNKLYVKHLVPREVVDYIYKNQLYL